MIRSLLKAMVAECLATCFFIYVGCGSIVANKINDTSNILNVALAFGLGITVLVFTVGHYSGGHVNPIVSIAMAIWGELTILQCGCYILAQLLGGLLGAALLSLTAAPIMDNALRFTINSINPNCTLTAAFLMEMVLSFLLVLVIGETAVNKQSKAGNNAPIAIGLTVFMAHIVAIPFTGSSINPARSFGPAILSGQLENLWLYFVAPIVGAVLAGLVEKFGFEINKGHDYSQIN